MIPSLLLKLGMLAITMGVVFWIRWGSHDAPRQLAGVAAKPEVAMASATRWAVREGKEVRQPPQRDQEPSGERVASAKPFSVPGSPLLDLNRAKAVELEALPGIGAVLAQRVIAFRDSLGGFRRVEDLRDVKGIGAKKFERLKLLVTVSRSDSNGTTERRVL